jgi:anastral spindle 1
VEDVWSQVLDHKEKQMGQSSKIEKQTTEVRTKQSEILKPTIKKLSTKEKTMREKSPAPPRRSPQMSKKVVVRESFPPSKQQSSKEQTQPPRRISAPIENNLRQQQQVKPILKQPKPAAPQPPEPSKNADHEELLLEKYAELTKNCSQRISDLAEMINKVREEKQKLLQSSLSSAGTPTTSGRPDSTEYLDFPPKNTSPQSADESKATNPEKEEQPSEEIANIFKSHVHLRQMGISKDSGISMLSRPVTSSEIRDSPDVRSSVQQQQRTKPVEFQGLQVIQQVTVPIKQSAYFEPLLKDIPKITTQFKAIANLPTVEQQARKPHRPPAALARYSPQLDAEQAVPHELSTILEIETPANSRFSFSVNQSQQQQPETSKKQISQNPVIPLSGNNSFRLEITNTSDLLKVREFQNCTGEQVHIDVSNRSDELDYRKFEESTPTTKAIEPHTLKNSASSSSSLPDVVAELKARNMLHDFEGPPDNSNLQHVETSFDTNLSVRKFQESNISGVTNLPASEGSSDTLEQDLTKMGLQWAASMIKKTKQTQNLQSSSSSSPNLEHSRKSVTLKSITSNTSAVSNTSHQGRPLNLREFLTRELMIRTHSETNSLSDDSSLSSQFLKSLLNLNTLNSTPEYTLSSTDHTPIQHGPTIEKMTPHRTSTPVPYTKTLGGTTLLQAGSGTMSLSVSNDLFSGESQLSSVKLGVSSLSVSSNTDCSISNKLMLSGMTKEDNLKIPNLKLSTHKYQSSTS